MPKQMHWFTIITSVIVTAILLFAIGSLLRFALPRPASNKIPVVVHIMPGAPTNEPQWQSPTYKKMYGPILYREFIKLTQPRLQALAPPEKLIEKKTNCLNNFKPESYLRVWGGPCATGYYLEIASTNKKIVTKYSLNTFLAKHNNTTDILLNGEQAASYLGTTNFLRENKDGVINGAYLETLAEPKEFIIYAEAADTCHDNDTNKYLYRVTSAGDITLLATWPRTATLCAS